MNADKKALRQQLLQRRLNLSDRLERTTQLQRVLRAFLVSRSDDIIGAYWPIKGEFDALPALYRWQEDALLGSELDSAYATLPMPDNPLEPRFFQENVPNEPLTEKKPARNATEFIASLFNTSQSADSADPADPAHLHAHLPSGPSASPRKIGLPVVDRVHKTLRFHAWWPGCPMEEDAYHIPKPKETEIITPTLLLVPLLGYGPGGYRLGYGGGFYDRTLAELSPKPFTIGLGFANSFVAEFRPEPHDVPLDAILTDHGQMWARAER